MTIRTVNILLLMLLSAVACSSSVASRDVCRSLASANNDFADAKADLQQIQHLLAGHMTVQLRQTWQEVAAIVASVDGLRQRIDQLESATCSDLRAELYPDILIQQNLNNGSSAFNRSWHDYKHGFNASDGSFWIGNDRLHQLTRTGHYKLRIDLQSRRTSRWYWAEYSNFTVLSEADNYRLWIGGFTGNVGRDAMEWRHNGMMFTTYDRDNDAWPRFNCAVLSGKDGGFWYRACSLCRLNSWGSQFHWSMLPGGGSLSTSRMRLVAA